MNELGFSACTVLWGEVTSFSLAGPEAQSLQVFVKQREVGPTSNSVEAGGRVDGT